MDRLRAIREIEQARVEIIRIAAQWQREGVDTSPLAEPIERIHRALRQLDAQPERPAANSGDAVS